MNQESVESREEIERNDLDNLFDDLEDDSSSDPSKNASKERTFSDEFIDEDDDDLLGPFTGEDDPERKRSRSSSWAQAESSDGIDSRREERSDNTSGEALDDTSGEALDDTSDAETSDNSSSTEQVVPRHVPTRELPMKLCAELGTFDATLAQLLQMREGEVFELGEEVGKRLKLSVDGHCIGEGELVKVGDHYGIRILELAHQSE